MARSRTLEIIITGKDKVTRVLKRITGGLKKWGKGALKVSGLVVAGMGAVTGALTVMFSKLAESIDNQAKVAAKLGLTNEALSVFRDAAGYAGIATTTFDMALQRMTRRVSEAANGTGEAVKALEELGLNAEELNKKSPDKALKDIVAALDGVKSKSDKLRLAFKLFDSEGVAMVNLTRMGLKQAQDDADALGLKLSESQAKGVEAANDAWARVKIVFGDFLKYVTAIIAPAVTSALGSAFDKLKEFDFKAIGVRMAQGIGRGVVLILEGVEKIGTGIVNWKIGLEIVRVLFLQIQLGIWKSLEGMRALNVAVRELEEKLNPLKLGLKFGGADIENEGLEKSKKILEEQRVIIAQIKKDIEASKAKGAGLLGDQEKSKTALDGFISKVQEVSKEIKQGAEDAEKAEKNKAKYAKMATAAYNEQFEAARRLNAELIRGSGGGSFSSVESLKKDIEKAEEE